MMFQQRVILDVKDNDGKIHTLLTHSDATFGVIDNVLATMMEYNKKESEKHAKKLSENSEEDKSLEENEKTVEKEPEEEKATTDEAAS